MTDLICENISVFRGSRRILNSISFTIPGGNALYVSGPNGAGKSTLLRGLATLCPISGQVHLNGKNLTKEDLCYIGHKNPLKASQTVLHTRNLWSSSYALNLDPHGDLPIRFLSEGQRRRLTLSSLLDPQKKVWLLDEPTVGLDHDSLTIFETIVQDYLAMGGIVILTGHIKPTFIEKELTL